MPRYKEVNPGLFTLISFPFLFGVMYGDIGHGTLLFLAASAMIYWEERIIAKQKAGTLGEIPAMAFGGRYVLVLMGAFAVYCGIIYNDCLSIPTNVYGSAWKNDPSDPTGMKMYNPTGWTYPCGVDPAWAHKANELAFYNSLKMKMVTARGGESASGTSLQRVFFLSRPSNVLNSFLFLFLLFPLFLPNRP